MRMDGAWPERRWMLQGNDELRAQRVRWNPATGLIYALERVCGPLGSDLHSDAHSPSDEFNRILGPHSDRM